MADSPSKRSAVERDTELRGNVPRDLLTKIDALMQANGYESRMDIVIPVMQEYVDRELHKATLLLRMVGINPLAAEPGKGSKP